MDTTELPGETIESNLLLLATLKARLGSYKTRGFVGGDGQGRAEVDGNHNFLFSSSLCLEDEDRFSSVSGIYHNDFYEKTTHTFKTKKSH